MIELHVTTPPSVNRLWKTKPGGGMYRSPEYKAWREQAGWEIAAQRPKEPNHWPKTIAGPYSLYLYVERPDNRRRDLANLEKAMSDLLQDAGLIEDDKFCQVLHMEWSGKGNKTYIKLEKYNGETFQHGTEAAG